MLDFLMVSHRETKGKTIEVYPKFKVTNSSDLMIRGGDFYAIWDKDKNLWSTDEADAVDLIDAEIAKKANELKADGASVSALYLWDAESGVIDKWHKYCQKQMWDNYHQLDEKLIFANDEVKREDYASKRLPYALVKGEHPAWDKLVGTLYSADEKAKLEWAIGAIVSGESKDIQKFVVLYGSAGTGKSTILNIIAKLFEGYCATFDAKALGSTTNVFALEAFRSNPLVAYQHDGDLSKIEDNTRINSLVSHETMIVNEKYKSSYANRFNAFLFMGTNKPVKITDAKSGLLRRLIDVVPSGEKLPFDVYQQLVNQTDFELGAIAWHCREFYLANRHLYDNYRPIAMMGATNDFYLFVYDKYYLFKEQDQISLNDAWNLYRAYCDEAKVPYPYPLRAFREELKNYFRDFKDRGYGQDGARIRSIYVGFRADKFENQDKAAAANAEKAESWLKFEPIASIFDDACKDCPAQYANEAGTPQKKWDDNDLILSDIITSKLHYVKVPMEHIVIDFDIPDENGEKSLEKNMEAAAKFPTTYAELSKSGKGVHLHYIYDGNPEELSPIFDEHIEIKVFKGGSALRRKLSMCNRLSIAHINSGLPKKEAKKTLDEAVIQDEKHLRKRIEKNLRKECIPYTKPSIDLIKKDLDAAYNANLKYDVSDMINIINSFAMTSSHNAEYCVKQVGKMKFKGKQAEIADIPFKDDAPIIFFDVEVFPNLFIICWKKQGSKNEVVAMINPSPAEVLALTHYRLIGFNNRRYDNHILYARIQNYSNEALYEVSQGIIAGNQGCVFGAAYNLSYTDIYDFSSKKQSLKKFEIELGIHHQELGLPWDQPVPKELWEKVADYCKNDVIATEAVFNARSDDWFGREMLVDMANILCKTKVSTVNDTTNTLTARIVFGGNISPQAVFNYRDLSKPLRWDESMRTRYRKRLWPIFDNYGQPTYERFDPDNPIDIPEGYSIAPFFPEYSFDPTRKEKSIYLGQEVGEGGRVFAQPGMYGNVYLDDIASMHPSSIEAEDIFGAEYTQRFADLKQIRIDIKHGDIEAAKSRLGGALAALFEKENFNPKKLSKALKIPINAVYGQTAAHFVNAFRDPRNVDNIVAKRGALFMMNLEREVKKRGYTVAHIKTDSIKIPDADEKIMEFVDKYGLEYGYTFEHEATYDKMCLVNNAVYIAKYKWAEDKDIAPGTWTATGTQFKIPYVFKTLFSHEPLTFDDYCVTQESKVGALYLDYGNDEKHDYHFVGKVGQFTPVKNGGTLVVQRTDKKTGAIKYDAAPGTTGYKWLESEVLRKGIDMNKKDEIIDISYFKAMDEAAVADIEKYGEFDWFASDVPYTKENNGILPF